MPLHSILICCIAFTGEMFTREPLDREAKAVHELVAEARDQGNPPRSARVAVRVLVTDVNDNAPDIVDPQEDVISVREEQPPGTEVVRVRAVDRDQGNNATLTYSILKGKRHLSQYILPLTKMFLQF